MKIPREISGSKVKAFIEDLGIDANSARELSISTDAVYVEVWAEDKNGRRYAEPNGEPAFHRISIKVDWQS